MSTYELSSNQLKSVNSMIALGFTHAKVELEAQLDRGEVYDDCSECTEGYNTCYECDGCGVQTRYDESPNGRELELTEVCDNCDGDGEVTCNYCDGDYNGAESSEWDNEACHDYIFEHVSPEAAQAINYSKFYNDGSVDSEFTFTLPMEKLAYAVEFIDAFNQLANAIGQGMDTDGAGMHLTVLTNANYPDGQKALDYQKLTNFKTEVTKLLPALYFVASPDHKSRGLQYRPPRISDGKYAAISTHGGTCLEYRIFETCYQRPTALLENFEVIAHTLKYYSKRTINLPAIAERLADGHGVGRFYESPEALEALNRGLPLIKPKDKPVSVLKAERGFKLTLKEAKVKAKAKLAQWQREYQDYLISHRLYNSDLEPVSLDDYIASARRYNH